MEMIILMKKYAGLNKKIIEKLKLKTDTYKEELT